MHAAAAEPVVISLRAGEGERGERKRVVPSSSRGYLYTRQDGPRRRGPLMHLLCDPAGSRTSARIIAPCALPPLPPPSSLAFIARQKLIIADGAININMFSRLTVVRRKRTKFSVKSSCKMPHQTSIPEEFLCKTGQTTILTEKFNNN